MVSYLTSLPIFAALGNATGTILEKIVIRKKKIKITLYQTAAFFAIILSMLPFIWFFWRLDPAALIFTKILVFVSVVIISIIANLFVFYSLKWEKISKIEPARILQPLFIILFAILFSFFFGTKLFNRNLSIIIPAIIASGALIFANIKKHHLVMNKYVIAAVLGSFFFALELVLSRLILDFYSPITFYFLRSSAIFLISLIIFKPQFKVLDKKSIYLILITGAIWAAYRIILYWGYVQYGIIFTTLLVMLAPVFIYSFAWKFLKDKPTKRNLIASGIIIACVVYVILNYPL